MSKTTQHTVLQLMDNYSLEEYVEYLLFIRIVFHWILILYFMIFISIKQLSVIKNLGQNRKIMHHAIVCLQWFNFVVKNSCSRACLMLNLYLGSFFRHFLMKILATSVILISEEKNISYQTIFLRSEGCLISNGPPPYNIS